MLSITGLLNPPTQINRLELQAENIRRIERRKQSERHELVRRLEAQNDYNTTIPGPKGRMVRRSYLCNSYPLNCTLHDKPRLLALLATTISIAQDPSYHVRADSKIRENSYSNQLVRTNSAFVCVVRNTLNAQRIIRG